MDDKRRGPGSCKVWRGKGKKAPTEGASFSSLCLGHVLPLYLPSPRSQGRLVPTPGLFRHHQRGLMYSFSVYDEYMPKRTRLNPGQETERILVGVGPIPSIAHHGNGATNSHLSSKASRTVVVVFRFSSPDNALFPSIFCSDTRCQCFVSISSLLPSFQQVLPRLSALIPADTADTADRYLTLT